MKTTATHQNNPYWGFWATVILGLLVFMVFSIIQTVALLAYVYVVDPQAIESLSNAHSSVSLEQLLNKYLLNGDALAVAEIPAAIIGVLMIIWFVSMKKSITIDQYLELTIPRVKSLLIFLALMIAAMVLMETVNYLLQRPDPEFMTKVYSNTQNLPLLWIAVALAAPFVEEFLFRGFLLQGMAHSKFGLTAAIILTSAAWAIIHLQYGWFEIISIFLIGILLCIAKLKSQSLYVPIAMHMLMNLSASIGMELTQ